MSKDKSEDPLAPAAQNQPAIRAGALPLPRDTTPTWEVELLISGVAVFAMLQLPGWLDERVFALRPRLSETWLSPLNVLHMYFESAAVILAVTFVLHLLLRAHWIALVGMHSVYPDGIRWANLKTGPCELDLAEQRTPDVPTAIERADNRSTSVFTIGVTLATILVQIAVAIMLAYPLLVAVTHLAGWKADPDVLMLLSSLPLVLPYLIAHLVDRRIGHQLHASGRPAQVLKAIFGLYSRIGFGRSNNPAFALISSHNGERRLTLLTVFLIFVTVLMVTINIRVSRNPESAGSYARFPFAASGADDALDNAHYANRRDPLRDGIAPYIQSDMPTDAYLRLLVPFDPIRDGTAMTACPPADADGTEEHRDAESTARQRRDRLLACLAALHPVTLDGSPVHDLRYASSADETSNRPALQAMIDIRQLPPGRHELTVAVPLDPDAVEDAGNPEPNPPYRIPFWR
ncbi:MAG: hypothetical protein KDI75_12220 [Xanthomonadales bacterium]|nr:hypothetical protein [Xanthomonadales bacterium]